MKSKFVFEITFYLSKFFRDNSIITFYTKKKTKITKTIKTKMNAPSSSLSPYSSSPLCFFSAFHMDIQPYVESYLSLQEKATMALVCKDLHTNLLTNSWNETSLFEKLKFVLKETLFSYRLDPLQRIILSFYDTKKNLVMSITKTKSKFFYKLDDFMISPYFDIDTTNEDNQSIFWDFLSRHCDQCKDTQITHYGLVAFDMKNEAKALHPRLKSILSRLSHV